MILLLYCCTLLLEFWFGVPVGCPVAFTAGTESPFRFGGCGWFPVLGYIL